MSNKMKVLVIFGGQSGEHEVSLISAGSIINALDRAKYDIETLGITKDGLWFWGVKPEEWQDAAGRERSYTEYPQVALVLNPQNPRFMALDNRPLSNGGQCDMIIPAMHGPKGEDGTIQGLFEMAGLPYVGSGVLGSALGMDKDRMKAVFREAGLPIVPHVTVSRQDLKSKTDEVVAEIASVLGYPCFIKPANLGSSVGISKAENTEQLVAALDYAALFDSKLVVEKGVKAREIELSVLGNDYPEVSVPGEIVPGKEFYDYEAKYIDTGSKLIIPAVLSEDTVQRLQDYAKRVFCAVGASGLGRVDFFVGAQDEIWVNEINTFPGFTQISMYPKLWEASGLPYSQLLDKLIELGRQRLHENKENRLS